MVVQEAEPDVVHLRVGTLDVTSDGTTNGKCVVTLDGRKVAWEFVRIILNRGQKPRVIVEHDAARKG